ncbi:hypothetical protein D7X33_05330 [Butyricicoccus sp. 1XD8-22]|nr:hypothetical protein D7X33_05330 [Butyricicoccus sp. 1XD8-22]
MKDSAPRVSAFLNRRAAAVKTRGMYVGFDTLRRSAVYRAPRDAWSVGRTVVRPSGRVGGIKSS